MSTRRRDAIRRLLRFLGRLLLIAAALALLAALFPFMLTLGVLRLTEKK